MQKAHAILWPLPTNVALSEPSGSTPPFSRRGPPPLFSLLEWKPFDGLCGDHRGNGPGEFRRLAFFRNELFYELYLFRPSLSKGFPDGPAPPPAEPAAFSFVK